MDRKIDFFDVRVKSSNVNFYFKVVSVEGWKVM